MEYFAKPFEARIDFLHQGRKKSSKRVKQAYLRDVGFIADAQDRSESATDQSVINQSP
jgi:hypothetical protein